MWCSQDLMDIQTKQQIIFEPAWNMKGMTDYLNQYTTKFLEDNANVLRATFLTNTKYRGAE